MSATFQDICEKPEAIVKLLESISEIRFARVKGQFWTTTGEINNFAGSSIAQSGLNYFPEYQEEHSFRLDRESVEDFSARMGFTPGRYNAIVSRHGYMTVYSPFAVLLIVLRGKGKSIEQLKIKLKLPLFFGPVMEERVRAILAGKTFPDAVYNDRSVAKRVDPSPSAKVETGGSLVDVLFNCLEKEKEAYDLVSKLEFELSQARELLANASADALAIARTLELIKKD